MASDLSLSISVSALVGGALSGLTHIGRAMNMLRDTTNNLTARQRALGEMMTRNSHRLSDGTMARLNRDYERMGNSIARLTRRHEQLARIQSRRLDTREQWESIKGQWQSALAAAGGLVLPVKLAIDFESAMAGVKKVVNFDTPEQFQQMGRDIVAMSQKIPLAASELAKIAESGGQLGIARQELTSFTETIAKMSVAFDMSADAAGESMAKLANVYQIPIAKISELGDAINQLSNSTPAKASEIVNTLSRVGGVARQFGLTERQSASLATAFISLGRPAEVAGTAINGMLTKLMTADKGGKKFQTALKSMGISAKQLKADIAKNGEQALIDFLKQVEKLPKKNQMGTLVDLFGLEYADDVAALVGGLKTYEQAIKSLQATDQNGKLAFLGSMEREFSAQRDTTAKQIQLLKNSLVGLGITVGTILLPSLNRFVAWAKQAVDSISAWAHANPELTKTLVSISAAMLAFVAGGFVARVMFNRLKAGILAIQAVYASLSATITTVNAVMQSGAGFAVLSGRLGRMMTALSAARAAVLGFSLSSVAAFAPFLLGIAAVAAAAWLVYKYWKPIKAFFIGFWQGLKQGLAPAMPMFAALRDTLLRLWDGVLPMFSAFADMLSGLWTRVVPYVQPIMDWFGEFFSLTQAGAGKAQSFGQAVGQFIGGAIAVVANFIGGKIAEIQAAFNGGLSGILALIANWSPLGVFYQAFAAVMSWFGVTLPAQFTGFGGMLIDGLVNGIQAAAGRVMAAIQNLAQRAKNAFASVMDIHSPSRVFRAFGGYITQGLAIGVNQGAPLPVSRVAQLAGSLKNRFAERMGGFRSDLSARLSAGTDGLRQARSEQQAQQQNANGNSMVVHFSPTINAAGGNPREIETALQMGLHEFEQLFRRLMAERERRAY